MGILAENLVWVLGYCLPKCSMLELGSQYLYIAQKPFPEYPDRFLNPSMTDAVYSKKFFIEEHGFDHVSIDLNGHGGSRSLDLSTHLELGRTFDIVTDFGTSEHVSDIWQCLENVHRATRVGGLIAHVNPWPGNWPGHGAWYRDEDFYRAYAALLGYRILDFRKIAACGNTTDGWNSACMLGKAHDAPFPPREVFNELPIKNR